jgi:acetylornithine deacetylase
MDWNLFHTLLSFDSTSGKERKVAEWLLQTLEAPEKKAMEVGDGTLNLLLSWGTPKVVFCSHLDTVPPYIPCTFEGGSAPLLSPCGSRPISPPSSDTASAERSDERSESFEKPSVVKGRGSCDAKGQVFAMYTACKELEKEGFTDFGLLLLAGEETGSWGAKAFSKTGFTAPFLIVGEPTENKMVSASKGTLSYDLKFTGKAFHSGYPQYGVSAVDLFNEFYNRLKAQDWGVDPELGETTWNVGLLHSDNPQNILSAQLTCRLYFRTTFVSHEKVKSWMEEIPGQAGNDGEGADIDRHGRPRPAISCRGGDTPAHYVTLPGFESGPVAFGSDAPHLCGFGHKIICGPGSIRVAHRPEEHILVKDLEKAVELYVKMYKTIWSK